MADMRNPHLRALLEAFLDDRTAGAHVSHGARRQARASRLSRRIDRARAVSCAICASSLAAHYSNVDIDLLLTGVILHDIGKVAELTYDRSFGYSSEGQLLGHIVNRSALAA